MSKLINKLDLAVSWRQQNVQYFLYKRQTEKSDIKIYIYFFIALSYTQVHFPPMPPTSPI